jgi:hypothetical protein
MQIEVSATRVIDMLAAKIGQREAEIARLQATNEVLTERLRIYVDRDERSAIPASPQNAAATQDGDDSEKGN